MTPIVVALTFTVAYNMYPTSASRAYPHGCMYHHPSYYTYDEREDISWANERQFADFNVDGGASSHHVDFRKLPSKSSNLRRPYERYRLTRKLGAGKFSEVYEAVDLEYCDRITERCERRRRVGVGRYLEGDVTDCTTEAEETEMEEERVDCDSLVVLKCLKPISERKIRRELLVLTHCISLPNLARLIGIALPESMDSEEEDTIEADASSHSQAEHPKKRRRKPPNRSTQQQHDVGSITDAATNIQMHKMLNSHHGKTISQKKTNQHQFNIDGNHNSDDEQQLPALILEHAGTHSKWFCHSPRSTTNGSTILDNRSNTPISNDDDHLSEREMKYYLCHLLIALDALHAAGIMHRDVKPRNCLINFPPLNHRESYRSVIAGTSKTSTALSTVSTPLHLPPPSLMLVDLGLADFYLPGKEYNVRVASRHYKSPELLIGYCHYDYAIDMWSVGCMLAGLLFRREPFFRGKDNEDQLGKIVSVLGTRDFLPYVRKCNVRLSPEMRAAIGKYCAVALSGEKDTVSSSNVGRRKPWLSFLSPTCPIPSSEALDLLDKLLVYDHEQRWTAREALGHSFFDEVREDVWKEVQERMLWESQWRSSTVQRS
ncbi:hypothetical protein HJC23_002610 [Cyclotella cryptica]|uniref:non-specific serine/threonine protein kinase n=1 Tax=Cyclotella cryptica TaxID=29204 RepID=A0ABD3PX96_9STRA|eukprot:CCRYP_010371-RA/>CCRYP_010371-RA protein AED:0.18 eAED:0.18 QI:0/0/0/1/1/1/3/0/601